MRMATTLTRSGAATLQPAHERPTWLSRPVAISLAAIPLLILTFTRSEHQPAALMAYLNAVIIGSAAVHFTRQGTLQGLIPVLFLLWPGMGWVLGTIYFAMFVPEMSYMTMNSKRYNLDGAAKLQSAILVFLLIYLSIYLLFAAKRPRLSECCVDRVKARRLALATLGIVVPGLTLNAVRKLFGLPGPLEYLANGANLYVSALPLVIGAVFASLNTPIRVITLAFLGAVAVFNVLGNARGDAAMPLAMFSLGYMFVSGVSAKRKFTAAVVGAVVFLAIVVIGDTTRVVLGNIGFGNLEQRVEALSQWREVTAKVSPFTKTFGRLYFTAGHTLVTMIPDTYSYLDFDPALFVEELLARQAPAVLYNHPPYYSTPFLLKRYDFNITEETSVELSFIGSLWMLGGWLPLILGSIGISLVHVLLSRMLARMARRSAYRAVFCFAMIALAILWAQNLDFISQTRWLAWRLVFATILYFGFVRLLMSGDAPPRVAVAPAPVRRART